jgi:acid phosphatase
LGEIKIQVKEYRSSGLWEKTITQVANAAKKVIREYKPSVGEKPAAVFDIDDTSLSNWPFLLESDFGYNPLAYRNWESTGKLEAIAPVLDLYRYAKRHGFGVFLITGRRELQRDVTAANLQRVGFKDWNGLYLKPMDYTRKHACHFKSAWRAEIVEKGYTLILNIGDQWSDLAGEPQADHNFKIPNPAYIIP